MGILKRSLALTLVLCAVGFAQGRGGRGGRGGNSASFPQRPPADPAALERGRTLYSVNCNFCHGSDARGGEGGPNLLRSELVLLDRNGEKIAVVLRDGRPDGGMPSFKLTEAQVRDLALFIHNFPVDNRDPARFPPASIVVGNAAAGATYFRAKCVSCHTGALDLKGVAARIAEPKALQNAFVLPGGGKPVAAVVTMANGQKAEGRVVRIDDFIITLASENGAQRTFRRDGDSPKVELRDPLQGHRDLLRTYTDSDIHNVTAYLVTLK